MGEMIQFEELYTFQIGWHQQVDWCNHWVSRNRGLFQCLENSFIDCGLDCLRIGIHFVFFGFKDFSSEEKIADLTSFQQDELASSCGFCVRKTQEIGDVPRFENYTKIEDWISHEKPS